MTSNNPLYGNWRIIYLQSSTIIMHGVQMREQEVRTYIMCKLEMEESEGLVEPARMRYRQKIETYIRCEKKLYSPA